MTEIDQQEQQHIEKAHDTFDTLLTAKTEEEAQQAFNQAIKHVSTLTPKERAKLRSKARKRQIRLSRAEVKARNMKLQARRQQQTVSWREQHVSSQFSSLGQSSTFVFSPNMKATFGE